LAQSDLALALAGFEKLCLAPRERLAAVAGAIAATARRRPAGERNAFFRGLREMTRPAVGYFGDAELGAEFFLSRVAAGQRVIDRGLARLAARLVAAGLSPETAAVVETVILARLLAAHRPHQIGMALASAAEAASRADYREG